MMSLRVPLMIAAGLAVSVSLWWREHTRRSTLASRWRERPTVTPNEFLQELQSEASTGDVERFRRALAQTFGVDPRRLRPDDHLLKDLAGDRLSRQRQLFFVAHLEREFDAVLPPAETCFQKTAGGLFLALIESRGGRA